MCLGLEKKRIMKGKVKIHGNPTKHTGYEKRRSSTGAVFRFLQFQRQHWGSRYQEEIEILQQDS